MLLEKVNKDFGKFVFDIENKKIKTNKFYLTFKKKEHENDEFDVTIFDIFSLKKTRINSIYLQRGKND
jgi:tRNA 2-selenouridine synthase SelU